MLMGCAHPSWGEGAAGPEAQRYYYFIKSNYKEIAHDDQAALENMTRASRLDPKSYYLKMETARLHARNDDKETALKLAQEAITLNPASPEPRLFAAWVAASDHKLDLAAGFYQEALKLDPNNRDALTYLGYLYVDGNKLPQAEAAFKQLVSKYPDHISLYHLGSFYLRSERLKEAIAAFADSVKKEPDFTDALAELAILYERVNDTKAAEKAYQTLIKARPEKTMPKARLADLLLKSGRIKEAEKLLNEISSLSLEQKDGQAQFLLGLIYMDQRLYNDATTAFEAAIKIDPNNQMARYSLARTCLEQGKIDRARAELIKIPVENELYADARLLLASAATGPDESANNTKEALEVITKAVKAKPGDPRLWAAQAMLLDDLGNFKQARKVLLKALKHHPKEGELKFRLGVTEDRLGNKAASIAAMRQALELNPEHADALNYLAYTWAEAGENLKEALRLAEKADALRPNSGYILDTLGWIHFHLGNTKKAHDILKKAVPLSNQDPVVLGHLGDVLLKLGRQSEALSTYRQALEYDLTSLEKLREELNEKINRLSE